MLDLSCFLVNNCFCDGFLNIFAYQATINMLVKRSQAHGICYWLYMFLNIFHDTLLSCITKRFGYKIDKKCNWNCK